MGSEAISPQTGRFLASSLFVAASQGRLFGESDLREGCEAGEQRVPVTLAPHGLGAHSECLLVVMETDGRRDERLSKREGRDRARPGAGRRGSAGIRLVRRRKSSQATTTKKTM